MPTKLNIMDEVKDLKMNVLNGVAPSSAVKAKMNTVDKYINNTYTNQSYGEKKARKEAILEFMIEELLETIQKSNNVLRS